MRATWWGLGGVLVAAALWWGGPAEAGSCRKIGEGCSVFHKCCEGYSCQPFIHKCYHKPRRVGEPCSAGYSCGSGLSCQPGVHKCYHQPRRVGEPCSAGYSCGSGLSCAPFLQKCYHQPRWEGEPCLAGFSCKAGYFCLPFKQRCAKGTLAGWAKAKILPLVKKAWSLAQRGIGPLLMGCSGWMDKLFDLGIVNKTEPARWSALMGIGRCGQEFTKGLICSIPDIFTESLAMGRRTLDYAWKHRKVCLTLGPVLGLIMAGPTPAAALPSLMCGGAFMLKEKLPKTVRCLAKLFKKPDVRKLLVAIADTLCNTAGSLVVDIIVAVLTAGSSTPGSIAAKIAALATKYKSVGKAVDLLDKVNTAADVLFMGDDCKW